jgi:hypothetical protein
LLRLCVADIIVTAACRAERRPQVQKFVAGRCRR